MITGTVADVVIVCALATTGTLMTAISWIDAVGLFAAATIGIDAVKVWWLARPDSCVSGTAPPRVPRRIGTLTTRAVLPDATGCRPAGLC